MWVQASGPPDRKVVLFDYTSSRAQDVPLRLLENYRGYVMTDDYAGYKALAPQPGVERLACMAHARRKFVDAQKVQPKGKTGRADIALTMINKLYGFARELKNVVSAPYLLTTECLKQHLLEQSRVIREVFGHQIHARIIPVGDKSWS